jgi:hypothetical protein
MNYCPTNCRNKYYARLDRHTDQEGDHLRLTSLFGCACMQVSLSCFRTAANTGTISATLSHRLRYSSTVPPESGITAPVQDSVSWRFGVIAERNAATSAAFEIGELQKLMEDTRVLLALLIGSTGGDLVSMIALTESVS